MLLRYSNVALALAVSLLLVACGGDSSTTPAPAPASAPPPAPPPPPPEPAQIAGDWLLVHEPAVGSVEAETPAEEDCFVDWWTERYSEPATRRDVILRIQQMDGEMVTVEWLQPREGSGEPWPPDLESAEPLYRSAGSVDGNDVSMMQTHARDSRGWFPFPIDLLESRVRESGTLGQACPEFSGETQQVTVGGMERSMTVDDEGTMSGTATSSDSWTIGDRTWIITNGPFPLRATPFEPPS